MKILWHSNAPWAATGYGQQTRLFAPLVNTVADTAISCAYGLNGAETTWEGMRILPGGYDAYGNDILPSHALEHLGHPDRGWIVILYDAWVFKAPSLANFHNAVWCPVDHDPVPPEVADYFRRVNGMPIAMSRFGQERLAAADLEALYVPHGIDPVFEPKGKVARQALHLPEDAFVVGMNMANKGAALHRKAFATQFDAFRVFAQRHDDAVLFVHSEQFGYGAGQNLQFIVDALGISDRVVFADQYRYRLGVPADAMPFMYSAFDVLMNATLGEGFGIPIVEAQACGVPVIVTDWTAMPELVGDGWAVSGDRFWHDSQASWWMIPSLGGLVDALEAAYERSEPSEAAVEFAAGYRADTVFDEYWKPVLANLQERIDPAAVAA